MELTSPTEADHLAFQGRRDAALSELTAATDSAERARVLTTLADAYAWWAEMHDETPGDAMVQLGRAFGLLRAVAAAETARATGRPREEAAHATIEHWGGAYLQAMVRAKNGDAQGNLLYELADLMRSQLGPEAAEALEQVAATYYAPEE